MRRASILFFLFLLIWHVRVQAAAHRELGVDFTIWEDLDDEVSICVRVERPETVQQDLRAFLLMHLGERVVHVRKLVVRGFKDIELAVGGYFSFLPNLQELDLAGNDLEQIPYNLFTGVPLLRRLSLARNRLAQFAVGTFSDLGRLMFLDISTNRLTSFAFPQGVFAELHGLRLLCIAWNAGLLSEHIVPRWTGVTEECCIVYDWRGHLAADL